MPMPEGLQKADQGSTSSSSGEVSVNFEKEAEEVGSVGGGEVEVEVEVKAVPAGCTAAFPNGGGDSSSGTAGDVFSRANTVPPEILNLGKSKPPLNNLRLERAKTERQTHHNLLSEEAAQIFDDKIPMQQKLRLLNRIATIKDDGTVEFEVPGGVEPWAPEIRRENCGEVDEPLDDMELRYIPPMQIVILIVGTCGDVQPFIAIGKKLQGSARKKVGKGFVVVAGVAFAEHNSDPNYVGIRRLLILRKAHSGLLLRKVSRAFRGRCCKEMPFLSWEVQPKILSTERLCRKFLKQLDHDQKYGERSRSQDSRDAVIRDGDGEN